VVLRLLDAFGKGLGSGYDIGCKFKTTLSRSSLAEPAWLLAHTSLVRSFHGCLCQLDHLATYVEGLGLEDLEGCEHAFSKSNALTSTVHYSGIFHCRQAITNYFEHNDEYNVYANLCTHIFPQCYGNIWLTCTAMFLHNNYKQALSILGETQERLPQLKHELNITDDSVFHAWLAEDRAYLLSRKKEPKEETAQMTYWQRLVNLTASRYVITQIHSYSYN